MGCTKSSAREATQPMMRASPQGGNSSSSTASHDDASPDSGDALVNLFRIDPKPIGQGSYAKVYRAVRRKDGLVAAVKCINKAKSRKELLNNELTIMRKFSDHDHIVKFYACYETVTEVQLVLEYMPGGELFGALVESGAYEEADAAMHVRSLGKALIHLHGHKVAHRDLKPENLLLTSKPFGVLKLSDFGLATILQGEELMRTACGTWAYCAPEVLNIRKTGFGEYDFKCDMFSTGVLMFVILSGYHPFDVDGSSDVQEMQDSIRGGVWDFEDSAWELVSKEAKDVIRGLLKIDPKARMSARELVIDPWVIGMDSYGSLEMDIASSLQAYRQRMRRKVLKAALRAVQTSVRLWQSCKGKRMTRANLREKIGKWRNRTSVMVSRSPCNSDFVGLSSDETRKVYGQETRPDRKALISQLFSKLDVNEDDWLSESELYVFMRMMNVMGPLSPDTWHGEYNALCEMCGWDAELGIDKEMFDLVVGTEQCDYYVTDADLQDLIDQCKVVQAEWDASHEAAQAVSYTTQESSGSVDTDASERERPRSANVLDPKKAQAGGQKKIRQDREELVQIMFAALDLDQNGWLNEYELYPLMKILKFDGDEEKWHDQYELMCQECSWDPNQGVNKGTLALLFNTEHCDFYVPDASIHDMKNETRRLKKRKKETPGKGSARKISVTSGTANNGRSTKKKQTKKQTKKTGAENAVGEKIPHGFEVALDLDSISVQSGQANSDVSTSEGGDVLVSSTSARSIGSRTAASHNGPSNVKTKKPVLGNAKANSPNKVGEDNGSIAKNPRGQHLSPRPSVSSQVQKSSPPSPKSQPPLLTPGTPGTPGGVQRRSQTQPASPGTGRRSQQPERQKRHSSPSPTPIKLKTPHNRPMQGRAKSTIVR